MKKMYIDNFSVNPSLELANYDHIAIGTFLLMCAIFVIFLIHSTNKTMDIYLEANKKITVEVQEENRSKPTIDLRYGFIRVGVTMISERDQQSNTAYVTSVFIFDDKDRLGTKIIGLAKSNLAANVSVIVDGVKTSGYRIRGLPVGPLPDSRYFRLNLTWLANSNLNYNLTSLGHPLAVLGDTCVVRSDLPRVTSIIDEANKDVRHKIDYLTN